MRKIYDYSMKRYAFRYPLIDCTLEWVCFGSDNIASVREDLDGKQILIGYTLYDSKVYDMMCLLSDNDYLYCSEKCIDMLKIKEVISSKIALIEQFKCHMNRIIEGDMFPWLLYMTSVNLLTFYYVGIDGDVLTTSLDNKEMSMHFCRYYCDIKDLLKQLKECGVTVTYEEEIDLYNRACKAYDAGEYLLEDKQFNQLEMELKLLGYEGVYKRYEDIDNIETDIDDSGYSIEPMGDWESIYRFIKVSTGNTLIFTLKYDGVHCKNITGSNFSSQSRSSINPIDYTKAMQNIFPEVRDKHLIMGEVFLQEKYLSYFRSKYDSNKFKLPRTSALTLLRLPDNHDIQDIKKLSFVAYNTDNKFKTKVDMFSWFTKIGLVSPKYFLYTFTGEESEDLIQKIIREIMSNLDNSEIPSDGVVMEYNDLTIVPDINKKYLSTQCAIKVDKWGLTYHTARVIGLNITKKSGAFGAVLDVEPVRVNGVTVTHINAYNVGVVLSEKIERGSLVKFIRKSNGMCFLKYGGDI